MLPHKTIITKDGRTVTVITDANGDQTVTATPMQSDGAQTAGPFTGTAQTIQPATVVYRSHSGRDSGAVFFMGMIMGAFILWLLQREGRRRRHRPDPAVADVGRDEVAALARRTATLEQIVTDPAARTARDIDALR